jgi:hypothetical protein
VRTIRRHIVVRIVTCLLLTWAAVDLLVPELCSSEAAVQDGGKPISQDTDDCFCCCSHTEKALTVAVSFSEGVPVIVERFPADNLPTGVPRSLYHPPLAS